MTTPTTPTHSDLKQEAFATRKTHRDELSCGAHVLIDRYLLDVVPDDDRERVRERLISVAQRCIGAGCEPRLSPLPGQDELGDSLAAPAQADQVEDTPTLSNRQYTFRKSVGLLAIHGEELKAIAQEESRSVESVMRSLIVLGLVFRKAR